MAVGLGFDVHKMVEGRKLILAQVGIPHKKGLIGVSDADVVLHSVSDAVLGAIGKGDIGDYFSPKNPKNRGISSITILKKALSFLKSKRIENLDITLILDKPKLKAYKEKMVNSLSRLLELPKDRVNLKIKSQEGLVPAQKECIICLSVVSIS